jgi:hypothetical protein
LRSPQLKSLCAFHLLLLLLCATTVVIAQSTDATISGLVLDSSGKVIPDADIEILNESTGVLYSGKTNETGIYTVSILPPGQYRLEVSKIGFKSLIKPGIVLNVQSAVALNFTLPIGAASETVTVGAGASLINTTDASVSTVIDSKFVGNMPLNGRSFQDLISMTPGVVTQSPQNNDQVTGYSGDFSVNGQRTESNYYTVDGVSANVNAGDGNGAYGPNSSGALAAATALGTTQSLVSVDALQEFRVQSSTYSAQYGRSPGGQFSFATRSGTNDFHASVFDYLRNNFFDANDWFNDYYGDPIPALRQNDFGGTLGGPILVPRAYNGRDKTFFFASYEGLRLTQPQAASIQYVPDSYMRQQAPVALQALLNAYPVQNGADYGTNLAPSLAEFIKSYSLPSRIDSTSVRLDHTFTPKVSAFFRFGYTPSSATTRLLSVVTQRQANVQSYTAGVTSQPSSKITNEFRAGYARSESSSIGELDAFGGASPINMAADMGAGNYNNAESVFQLYFPAIGSTQLSVDTARNQGRQWNVTDTFSISAGRHWLQYGVDYLRMESPTNPPSPIASALFESSQTVLANAADSEFLTKDEAAAPVFREFSAFIQDEWRVRPPLNLSLGLRWEVNPPPGEAHGNDAYTLSGNINDPSSLALAPQGTPLWKTSWYNLAPRIGAAWTVNRRSGWETVLRGGGGVFFDTDNKEATQGFGGIGFDAYQILAGAPLPFTLKQLDFSPSTKAPYTSSTIYAFPNQLQLPYTLEWSASLEQAMGKTQALTLSYVGSNGRRLIDYSENYLQALNPNFGYVIFFHSGLTSNYQAMQAKLQRSASHGLQILASYTWSHSIDFGSNDYALQATRGNSDFDVRNNFQGGLSWDIPSTKDGGFPRLLLHSWGLDLRAMARSGFPVTLNGNYLTDAATGSQYYGNVDQVPDQPVYLFGSLYPGRRAINPAAITYPAGNGTGDAPRNFVRGFGAVQINLAARRQIKLSDELSLQFRAETFNLLNHPNFGYIDPNLGDATFGLATEMLNQSLGTMASQYQQGGPRSMQFALKLIF